MSRLFRTLAATACLIAAAPAFAAHVRFDTDPFAGSTADPDDGVRTVFGGNERQLPAFDLVVDRFVFNPGVFDLPGGLNFTSGLASALPSAGVNVVVLQSTDNDGNPATPFNAGTAASLIAAAIEEDGAGFFIYHNSGLQLNRLVYSTNLNSATADLSILARITTPTGAQAVALLPVFTADNFTVPEPGTWALALLGLGAAALGRRRAG
jgi:MYXO-CTERM domain-containing protein